MTSSYSIIGVIYHDDVINELLDNCQTSSYSIIGVASYGDIIIEFLGCLCCLLSFILHDKYSIIGVIYHDDVIIEFVVIVFSSFMFAC